MTVRESKGGGKGTSEDTCPDDGLRPREGYVGVDLGDGAAPRVKASGVALPTYVVLVLVEYAQNGPIIAKARGMPVATRIVVATTSIVLDDAAYVLRHLLTALVDQFGCGPAVRIERVVTPWIGRRFALRRKWILALVEPRGHGRELLRHRVGAREVEHRARSTDSCHEVRDHSVKERGVPVCRRLCRRTVGRSEFGHSDARVREPGRETHEIRAQVGQRLHVCTEGSALVRAPEEWHHVDLDRRSCRYDLLNITPVDCHGGGHAVSFDGGSYAVNIDGGSYAAQEAGNARHHHVH